MNRYLVILLPLLVSCRPEIVERHCIPDEQHQVERATFILECARVANPHSDEEPEDMLAECNRIAKETFCTMTWVVHTGEGRWIACANAQTEDQASCVLAGWGKW